MKPRTLLVADDDEDMRRLVAGPLRRRGFVVVEVADGIELLEYLGSALLEGARPAGLRRRSFLPEVLISDINMPGMNGLELVGELRREGWEVPVVFITALRRGEVHRKAARLDALLFRKPFDVRHLCDTVERLVETP